jgi:hypothetical protein
MSVVYAKKTPIEETKPDQNHEEENLFLMHTCTSNVKYFFRFFTIMTRNGSLMPSVFLGSAGQVMKVVLHVWSKTKICLILCLPCRMDSRLNHMKSYLTLVPIISSTRDWMSLSVMRLMCPFLTCNDQRRE